MPELILQGCTPEPLMSYLKALGILRLVAEQADHEARGAWRTGEFVLQANLDAAGLTDFFLNEYKPTPIVAPWAGGSGFFGRDNRKAVEAIVEGAAPRVDEYRKVICQVRAILAEEGQTDKPSEDVKDRLLRRYRRELPDSFVTWMDCALVLQSVGQTFPPLLGTGGNDGRLDFTQNYMQRLVDLGIPQGKASSISGEWVSQAVFAQPAKGLLNVAIGQFDPGHAGGPNAGQGMMGDSHVNPWDFVFMIEGALLLAGSVARRMGAGQRDKAVFPFTVRPTSVGYASASENESAEGRGEIWLPLWSSLASPAELHLIFAEGRAELSGKQSRDSTDFARAVASLGVDRGIAAFVRFGFLKRSGKAFVAAPLGVFEVRERRDVDLLREVDPWLDGFRRACRETTAPPRFSAALRRIDAAIFDFCRYGGSPRMAEILRALGNAERELANGEKFRKTDLRAIHPVPPLSPAWISACADGSAEYRLALSLAFMQGDIVGKVGNLRTNLEPVQRPGRRWSWAEKDRAVVWSGGDLCRNFLTVLMRRSIDATRAGLDYLPLDSCFPVALDDIGLFLAGETDDGALEELLWGAILLDRPDGPLRDTELLGRPQELPVPLPRAYALLKLLFLPGPLPARTDEQEITVKPEPEILGRLRAGKLQEACEIAARRLRASGLIPLPGPTSQRQRRPLEFSDDPAAISRLAAALLFPVYELLFLTKLVLRPKKAETAETSA
jgi:CRISPR-associated protein Csx17